MSSITMLRALPALLLTLVAFSFSSCASVPGIPAPLTSALQSVTGLTGNIGDWGSKLGSSLGGAQFDQLKEYAGQASGLGSKLTELKGSVGDAMANPLGAITDKLAGMGNINVDSLRNMAPDKQMKAVSGFTESAGSVGDLTKDFISKFGK